MKRLMFITVMCAFITAPAMADLTFVAEYAEGNSWTPGAFITENIADHMQMTVSVPGALNTPALTPYGGGLAGWSETYNDGTTAVWDTGTPGISSFYIWFEDVVNTQSFTWYLQSYLNGQLNPKDDNWITFTNCNLAGIGGPPSGWDPGYIVPVPGAVLLGLLGLSAAGIKLRKFA